MVRKQKKYHFIYKTTNNLSGKYYIGMHSTDNLKDGYMGSGRRLRYSINKYGKDNHTREVLEYCSSREELKSREAEIVSLNEIAKEDCINLVVGGEGGFISEIAKLGRIATNKILEERYGDNYTSKMLKEYHDNLSEEERLKRGENIKNGLKRIGHNHATFTDKKHSDESKQKMSESMKGKGTGKSNSQYGTCWVTNETENKKIKKELLPDYESEGWCRGRKLQ
jgi:hypothetical protein